MTVNSSPNPDTTHILHSSRRVSRRTLLAAAFVTPALAGLLAACGDDTKSSDPTSGSTGSPGTTPGTTTGTTGGTTAPPDTTGGSGFTHPTGADDVVLRFAYVGGFVPAGFAFVNTPNLLVSGTGRLITPGVTTAIYPGQLLPALNERTISEAGIQKLLELADTAQLLGPAPDYSGEILVADAPNTVVEIHANGETYTHDAPALGFDEPNPSDARKALVKFVELIGDLPAVVGADNLGPEAPLVADSYRMQARVVTEEELSGFDLEPTIVPWPADIGVVLADAAECAVVTADKAGTLFTDANQLTFFSETSPVDAARTLTYQVTAVAVLPGDGC